MGEVEGLKMVKGTGGGCGNSSSDMGRNEEWMICYKWKIRWKAWCG